ncbi:hypothetical protein DFJ74DRAFT_756889 [Hyaloraphidium curvatum]|nr:hypothetical protein DFJ74DRAFT_756889 [Hyaloraphidium curvatum]
MDLDTFLKCQPWLRELVPVGAGSSDAPGDGAADGDRPAKKRRTSRGSSPAAPSQAARKPPACRAMLRGTLRFAASLDGPRPGNAKQGTGVTSQSSLSGPATGQSAAPSQVSAKQRTPKKQDGARAVPLILRFAPRSEPAAELAPAPPAKPGKAPKYASTKRNSRVVVPLEPQANNSAKDVTRFRYALHVHPYRALLFLTLNTPPPSDADQTAATSPWLAQKTYLVDHTSISLISLPPLDPKPDPVAPHVACAFASGTRLLMEADAPAPSPAKPKEQGKQVHFGPTAPGGGEPDGKTTPQKPKWTKKGKDPRNSRAHCTDILRRGFTRIMRHLTHLTTSSKDVDLSRPLTVMIAGTEFVLPPEKPPIAPLLLPVDPKGQRKRAAEEPWEDLSGMVEAALALGRQARERVAGLVEGEPGAGADRPDILLRERLVEFARSHLVASPQ